MDEGLSAVERVAALLEGVEAGHVTLADLATVAGELVYVLADLKSAPAGWVDDLGRMLRREDPPAASAAGSEASWH